VNDLYPGSIGGAQDWQAWSLENSGRFILPSPQGGVYGISVAWPSEPPPRSGFPVVYLLDGNAVFATVVEASRRGCRRFDMTAIPPAVIVGVGSPRAELYAERRQLDFTFTRREENSGGGEAFLSFLRDRLIPRVEASFPADPHRRSLFGHSLGGLFSLSVFLNHPGLFRNHLAMSPSIWWDRDGLMATAAALPARLASLPRRPSLLMTVGEYEEAPSPWLASPSSERLMRIKERRMVANVQDMASRLAACGPKADVSCMVLASADHGSVVLPSIEHGLRMGFA
jgi:predicted alpha/beta superfamily hydrolase